jgi:hypothetical protein
MKTETIVVFEGTWVDTLCREIDDILGSDAVESTSHRDLGGVYQTSVGD